jgi:peptidyl-dipeptidase Dcp
LYDSIAGEAAWPTLGRYPFSGVKDVGQQSFFEISLLPYQAPHFDEINDSHYRPAFDEAIRQKRADIAAIVAQTAAPDFNNTVLALEKSGAMLSRVSSVFFAMTSAHQ